LLSGFEQQCCNQTEQKIYDDPKQKDKQGRFPKKDSGPVFLRLCRENARKRGIPMPDKTIANSSCGLIRPHAIYAENGPSRPPLEGGGDF
jgi:hypothetical protein